MPLKKEKYNFTKNIILEKKIKELSDILKPSESILELDSSYEQKPNLFIMGCPRSGTSLLYQLFANCGAFSYPSNFLSRFYSSLGVGSKIQNLLFSDELQYRDELSLKQVVNNPYESVLGKTKGALSPNVFWYFWYYHYNLDQKGYLNKNEWSKFDHSKFLKELGLMQQEFKKPIVMKASVINWNVIQFSKLMPNALFIRIKRNRYDVANSIYNARKTHSGNFKSWWSFKPPEYQKILALPAKEQVAAFYLSIEKALDISFRLLPEDKKIVIEYEDLCRNPNTIFDLTKKKYKTTGTSLCFNSVASFNTSKNSKENKSNWYEAFNQASHKIEFSNIHDL